MALTLFLFKVSNINTAQSNSEVIDEDENQLTSETPTRQFVIDERTTLLSAKVTFRGIY
jgi:hypothetical protein